MKKFGGDIYAAGNKFSADNGSLLSASVAYYATLSFFPLLLILIAGLGLFFEFTDAGQNAEQQVIDAISDQASPMLAEQVGDALRQVREQAGVSGPIGLATLLLTAMLLFAQFETALDHIFNTEPPESQGIWKTVKDTVLHRFRAFLMILGLGLLLIVIFVAGLVLGGVQTRTENWLPMPDWVWWLVQTAVTVGLNGMVFALVFKLLPKKPVRWGDAIAGGLLTAVIWEVGRQILAAYVIGGRYTSAYGVVGSFIAIMLWIYYAVSVVFFGAEYVQIIAGPREQIDSK